MPRLAIAKEFLAEFANLDKPVQRAVESAFEKFQEHRHPGQHLEAVRKARDPRIRTIRVDKSWRGVVLAPESGDVYCLLRVLPHDEAYAFARSRQFTVNERLGVLEVRDASQLEGIESTLHETAEKTPDRLFDHINDADLKRLGVDGQTLPVIRLLTQEAHLEAMAHLLPARQYEALFALASGMSVEETWAEVSKNLVDATAPEQVDPDDLTAAIERTPGEVRLIDGPDELAKILAYPFDAWRIFLHPSQERIARRPSYTGPAMVTGGAGTGKTVTAMHRAAFLAARHPDDEPCVLLTTFSKPLQRALDGQLDALIDDPTVRGRVDVKTTDAVAAKVVRDVVDRDPDMLDNTRLVQLWDAWAAETDAGRSGRFLLDEWEQVILGQDLTEEETYVAAERRGRGERLAPAERPAVWATIVEFLRRMRAADQWSFLQIADEAAHILEETDRHLYRHVIVDEAQDLHPAQWRLLRAAVPASADDLFIAGDPHQRIWQHQVSLRSQGIEVRGRSSRLTVSYRTTQEILGWAVRVLGLVPATGLDDREDTLAGYESPMHGHRPIVSRFPDRDAEVDAVTERVKGWLDDGVRARYIGVATRVSWLGKAIKDRLKDIGVTAVSPTAIGEGVRVGTMHAMKGLEFRCVAVAGVNDELVPHPKAVVSTEVDTVAHAQDLQRERCLLFVACTRARDRLYVSHHGRPSRFLPG